MFWLQLSLIIISLALAMRFGGGILLGLAGGTCLAILVFIFGLTPSSPPIDVMLIIMTVSTTTAVMQAAGGMDYLVSVATRLLRKNPSRISFFGPLVAYVFTFMAGTGNVAFSIIPVIAEVAREAGVRPERPLSISIIASQHAITASPISAATVAMVALLAPFDIGLIDILMVTVPATLLGCFLGACYSSRMGKDLDKDPEYLARVKNGEVPPLVHHDPDEHQEFSREAKLSVALFILTALGIVLFGLIPELRPMLPSLKDGAMVRLNMTNTIEILMMFMGAAILLSCKVKASEVINMSVFKQGMMGVFCIFGLAWTGDTFVTNNMDFIRTGLSDVIATSPWIFAFALFGFSALILSQAATVRAVMPLGIALGIPAPLLVGMFPAVNGYFFIPSYATLLAGVAFDETKTTHIGKYVFNHSYMMPGLIAIIVAVATGLGLATIVL